MGERMYGTMIGAMVLCLSSLYGQPVEAHNAGKMAYAIPLERITIDGKLDDWPDTMAVYPIDWIHPTAYKPTLPEGPEVTTECSAPGLGHARLRVPTYLPHGSARGKTADLRRLLLFGADPDVASRTGETPLMSAADNGRPRAVELLLRAEAWVDARDRDGWTALMRAVNQREPEIAELLLAAGADPSRVSELGWSALHLAARRGDTGLVRALLAAGAEPNVLSQAAATPLIQAVKAAAPEAVAALLAAGADSSLAAGGVDALWWARRLDNLELEALLEEVPG